MGKMRIILRFFFIAIFVLFSFNSSASISDDSAETIAVNGSTCSNNFFVATNGYNCQLQNGPNQYIKSSKNSCIAQTGMIGVYIANTILSLGLYANAVNSIITTGINEEGAYIHQSMCNNYNGRYVSCIADLKRGSRQGSQIMYEDIRTTSNPCEALPNLDKIARDKNGSPLVNSQGQILHCPLIKCDIPSEKMKLRYLGDFWMSDDVVTLEPGKTREVGFLGLVSVTGESKADEFCVSLKTFSIYNLKSFIACKPRALKSDNSRNTSPNRNACYISNVCISEKYSDSRSFFIFTSRIAECIRETVLGLIFSNNSQCTGNDTTVYSFQIAMRNIVRIALILYVILFGIKIALSNQGPNKSEVFLFVGKIILVMWLGVGTFSSVQEAKLCRFGDWCGTNGINVLYSLLISALDSFSAMVINGLADNNGGICNYTADLYSNNKSFLAVWDALDCRIAYYFGLASPSEGGLARLSLNSGGYFINNIGILLWIIPSLFSAKFLFSILIIIFALLLFSMIIYLLSIYLMAMISITMLIFFAPIMVPFVLFKQTSGYFEGWLSKLVGYTVQPAIVCAFIALMLATMDQLILSDCKFIQKTIKNENNLNVPYWVLQDSSNSASLQSEACKKSIVYLYTADSRAYTKVVDVLGGVLPMFKDIIVLSQAGFPSYFSMLSDFSAACIFLVIFYFFSKNLEAFVTSLSGTPVSGGLVKSPTSAFTEVGSAAMRLSSGVKGAVMKPSQRNAVNKAAAPVGAAAAPAPAAAPAAPPEDKAP